MPNPTSGNSWKPHEARGKGRKKGFAETIMKLRQKYKAVDLTEAEEGSGATHFID